MAAEPIACFNHDSNDRAAVADDVATTAATVARVQAAPKALPPPITACAREPRCGEPKQEASMNEPWAQLMRSTEQEILEGSDVVGAEAHRHMGRVAAPRWVTRKVALEKSRNRPRLAWDTRWWSVLSNRLRQLRLMEALPTRRPHLP